MNGSRTGYVYTLTDPRTGDPRYVGATVNPRERYWGHLSGSSSEEVSEWVAELDNQDLKPGMEIVESVDVKALADAERRVLEQTGGEHELLNSAHSPAYPSQSDGGTCDTGGDYVEIRVRVPEPVHERIEGRLGYGDTKAGWVRKAIEQRLQYQRDAEEAHA